MTHDDVATRLRAFLNDTFPHDDIELTMETDLLDTWFVDSFGILQTVMFLEEEFGLELGRSDVQPDRFRTLAALIELVESRLPSPSR